MSHKPGRIDLPHLAPRGRVKQLILGGKPFLALGGELGNSSASSLEHLEALWPKLVRLGLNFVLAPVYWELFEPHEGTFDTALIDGLVDGARRHDIRLGLLWFASFKNSMSCYAPAWVKSDFARFPRARLRSGRPVEILSAFEPANWEADARAYAALMRHLRQVDGERHTVLMVQVENEIGMLGDAREWSPRANEAFRERVPNDLAERLKSALAPELRAAWEKAGAYPAGTWEETFGAGLATDEIFMAWHYARYVERVTQPGKAEYALPMYVNAALNRPHHEPGRYPSAGPLPHLIDVWHAGAPSIDFLSPDIYYPDFAGWSEKYARTQRAFFIPEAQRGPDAAAHAFYAVGRHHAMGFCPFSIESEDPEQAPIARAYAVLAEIAPLVLARQGSDELTGVLLDKQYPDVSFAFGGYMLRAAHDFTWEWSSGDAGAATWPRAGGLIMVLGPDEFLVAGTGIIITFSAQKADDGEVGILSVDEGKFEHGNFIAGRRLNGDEDHQGRHVRVAPGEFAIRRVKLYRYD
jgi:beta-galactosidase GanA